MSAQTNPGCCRDRSILPVVHWLPRDWKRMEWHQHHWWFHTNLLRTVVSTTPSTGTHPLSNLGGPPIRRVTHNSPGTNRVWRHSWCHPLPSASPWGCCQLTTLSKTLSGSGQPWTFGWKTRDSDLSTVNAAHFPHRIYKINNDGNVHLHLCLRDSLCKAFYPWKDKGIGCLGKFIIIIVVDFYPLEKGMATHSNICAWRIPWTEEPVGHSPWGCKELDKTE